MKTETQLILKPYSIDNYEQVEIRRPLTNRELEIALNKALHIIKDLFEIVGRRIPDEDYLDVLDSIVRLEDVQQDLRE